MKHSFSQEKLKVTLKDKGLVKKYKFSHKQIKVVPKGKGLAKKEV